MDLKSHALLLMSYIEVLEVEHTHCLVRCQSVREYDAIGSECCQLHSSKRTNAISQAADHVSVHCKYSIIIIGLLKS